MPSSTETYRSKLAQLQARTLSALIAGREGDAAWIDAHLPGADPAILEQGIRKVHSSNQQKSMAFFLPRFAAMAPIRDWHALSGIHPTVGQGDVLLDHFSGLAHRAIEGAGWRDLVVIERAEFRVRNMDSLSKPDLVAQIRAMQDIRWDAMGCMDTEFGSFVKLSSTWYDVHWIDGHSPEDAVSFGPDRWAFFCRIDAGGPVRSFVFEDLAGLAITLCFA